MFEVLIDLLDSLFGEVDLCRVNDLVSVGIIGFNLLVASSSSISLVHRTIIIALRESRWYWPVEVRPELGDLLAHYRYSSINYRMFCAGLSLSPYKIFYTNYRI